MKIRPGVELANLSDVGCERTANEDYYCYVEPGDDAEFRRRGRLAIVADGMGGHKGGQVASGMAVDVVRDTYLNSGTSDPREALVSAFRNAHAAIQEHAGRNPDVSGMGTTCTALALVEGSYWFGHVGDSRLYLIRNGGIDRLTEDHSYVNQLVRSGALSPADAATHPDRNILTAALGVTGDVAADFSEAPLAAAPGDILLLCTDGLHGLVNDREMLASATGLAPSDACRELVEMAKARGGHDNITLQILRILG